MNAATQDSFRIISKLNPSKVANLFLLVTSYYLTKWTRRPIVWGLPYSLSIEPTTACNLGCPECPSGLKAFSRDTGNLKTENLERWMHGLSKHVSYVNFYFQGEPYIHPKFFELISLVSKQKIYTATSTNAHFLSESNAIKTIKSGLDRIIISIDGTTQSVYEQYRVNGDLQKVIEGTRTLIKAKKDLQSQTPFVIFQFLVVKPNEHQIDEVKKLAEELGVDELRFKTAQVYDPRDNHPLIPTIEKYSRYTRKSDGTYHIKNELKNECRRMWMGAVITWDGKVVPCCFDKDAKHQMGDLQVLSFREIWKNPAYQSFRKQLFTNRESIDICANCSEGTKVWA
jgi:radical SAM protein with 4Fe4S-binding SPASM domain